MLVTAKGIKATNAQLASVDATARKAGAGAAAMGSRFAKAAKIAAAALAVTLGLGLHAAIAKGMEFERQMSSLGSVAEATARQQGQLEKQALRLGEATQYSASETAEAQIELAKGGLKTKEILGGGLPAALSLAAAGQLELADAATATVNGMKLFGLSGKEATHIADLYATAANTTTADVLDFAMAMTQGGSAAKQAGLDIDETTLILEALAEAGIKNSDAGTSLKTSLVQLLAPTKKQREEAERLGIVWTKRDGTVKSAIGLSRELRQATDDLTKSERLKAFATLAGTDGFRTLAALYDAGPAKLERMARANQKQGTAQEVAAKKMDNLKGDVEQLEGAFETLEIQLMHGSSPALREITQDATELVTQINHIVNNKALTGEQKVDKIFDVLAGAASTALTKVTEEAAQYGPRFIKAFAHGMLTSWSQMSPLAKLFSVGVLLKAVGGKGALFSSGGAIGRWLGLGIAAGTKETVAGGGAAGGGLVGGLKSIKWRRVAGLGLGVLLADGVLNEFSRRAEEGSDSALKALGAKADTQSGLEKSLTGIFNAVGGKGKIDAPSFEQIFGGSFAKEQRAAKNLVAEMEEMSRKRVRLSEATIEGLRAQAKEVDLSKSARKQVERMLELAEQGRELHLRVGLGSAGQIHEIKAYLKNLDLLKSGVITRMSDISQVTQENLDHINNAYKTGTPKWRDAVVDNMKASVAAIKAGMEAGVIETETGQKRIRTLLHNMKLLRGKDPTGIAEGFARGWTRAGDVTEEGIENEIRQLQKMPKGAREQARLTMVGMARTLESEGKLPEGAASRLNSALTTTFGRTRRQIEHSMARAMANIAQSVEEGDTNVTAALGSIQASLARALEALGSSKIPTLVLAAASQYHHAREATMSGFETGGFVVPGHGDGDRPFPGGLEVGSFVLNREATRAAMLASGGRVPVELEPGEAVFGPREVKAIGLANLEAMNKAVRRKDGGPIGEPQFSGPAGPVREIVQLSAEKATDAANAYYERHKPKVAPGGVSGYTGPPANLRQLGDNAYVDSHTLAVTALLDRMFGLTMSSGYRSPAHNAAIGGAPGSLHTHGSPGNPGATDSVGSMSAMRSYIDFARRHVAGLQEAMVDNYAGLGYNAHLGFFRRGGLVGRLAGGGIMLALASGGGVDHQRVIEGKVTWFNGGRTAGASDTSRPGLALNLHPGTDSGWNNQTTQHWMALSRAGHPVYGTAYIGGHSARLPITDLGPAGWTGNAIDVTEGGVRKLGFSTSNFPSGSIGKVVIGAAGASAKHPAKTKPDAHSIKEPLPGQFHQAHTHALHFPQIPNNIHGLDREITRWKDQLAKYQSARKAAQEDDRPRVEHAITQNISAIRKQLRRLRHEENKVKKAIARKRFTRKLDRQFSNLTGFETAIESAQRVYETRSQKAQQVVDLEPVQGPIPEIPDHLTIAQRNKTEEARQSAEEAFVDRYTHYVEGQESPAYGSVLDAEATWRNTILQAESAAAGDWQNQPVLGGMEGNFETRIIALAENEKKIKAFIDKVTREIREWRDDHKKTVHRQSHGQHHAHGGTVHRQSHSRHKRQVHHHDNDHHVEAPAGGQLPAHLQHARDTREKLREKLPELRFREQELREKLGEARELFYPGKARQGYELHKNPAAPAAGSGSFEDSLTEVQGRHWADQHEFMQGLPVGRVPGRFGGAIWETQSAIAELGIKIREAAASVRPANIEKPQFDNTAQLLEVTQQLLREANTRNAVAEAQGAAISGLRAERSELDAGSSAFAGFFAAGGTIPAGQWGVVGEHGPEPVFAGPQPATVFSHGEGREMFGGGETSVQVIVNGDINPAPGVSADEVIEVLERDPRSRQLIRRTVLGGRGIGRRTAGDGIL